MNIQLSDTKEYINRKFTGALGQVLIRYVRPCWIYPPATTASHTDDPIPTCLSTSPTSRDANIMGLK